MSEDQRSQSYWYKLLNKWGRTELLCKIPNNLCRLPPRRKSITPHSCGCAWLLLKCTVWKERHKNITTMEKLDKQVIKVSISSGRSCWWCVPLVWCDESGILCAFPPQIPQPQFNLKKNFKFQPRGILKSTWPVHLKTVKFIQNKENLRNCHSQEMLKLIWQPNVMWYSGWGPGTEDDIRWKPRKSE